MPDRDKDGYLYKGLNADRLILIAWLIGVYSCPFKDVSPVSFRIHPQDNRSLPSRGDQPVKMGYCATSARLNSLYLEGLVSLVKNRKAVFNNLPFFDFLSVVEFFRQDHLWAVGLLGPTC